MSTEAAESKASLNGTTGSERPAIFQRLDTVNKYPYSLREYAKRFAWELIGHTMVRFSFRRASRWRRFWLRRFDGTIPSTSHIKSSTVIRHPWLLKLGEYTTIAEDVEIYNLGPVEIGDHSVVSQRAYICAGTHDYSHPSLPLIRPSIKIGSGVWVCAGAFIGPGVEVGDNSVVGAYAVVTKDVPPNTIVAGNPARVVRERPMRTDANVGANRLLNITIVLGPFLAAPPAPCGAVELIWKGLAEEFIREGHHVTIICRRHESQGNDEIVNGVRYKRRGAFRRTGRLWIDLAKDLAYSLRILPAIPRGDILVTNVCWLPVFSPALRAIAGQTVVNVGRMPKGQTRLYARTARLAAVSNAVADAIAAESKSVSHLVRVIPNPVDIEVFKPKERPANAERTILFTGRIHPEKGVHVLLDAFRRLLPDFPDLRLRVIGPWTVESGGGGPAYVDRLKAIAGEMPVQFDEPIYDREELAAAIQSSDFYCYPSLAEKGETFGVAALEGMACGTPCIVSDLHCFRDFVEDGRTGVVFNHRAADPAGELEQAFRSLLQDLELAARIGTAGAERAREFSYQAVAEQYLNDFRLLLRAQRPMPAVAVNS